jgi:hypothetical protein
MRTQDETRREMDTGATSWHGESEEQGAESLAPRAEMGRTAWASQVSTQVRKIK